MMAYLRLPNKNNEDRDISVPDQVQCIKAMVNELTLQGRGRGTGVEGIHALENEIEKNFGPDPLPPDMQIQRVQLATVHKAKGLGWDRVYLLQPKDLPLQGVLRGGGWKVGL